jgi:lactaldehyde reductase
MAGIAFCNAQVALVHAMAHTLGGLYGVPHGLANSILLPHVVRFNMDACGDRYVLVARAMGLEMKEIDAGNAGVAVAHAISAFTTRLGIPQTLREAGVPEDGLVDASEVTLTQGPMVFNPKPVGDPQEILGIYKNAW